MTMTHATDEILSAAFTKVKDHVNPFVPNAPFLHPLKTSKNQDLRIFLGSREKVHWKQMS